MFCNFPKRNTFQQPSKERKSSPAPESERELLDANVDDLRTNE